MPVFIKVLLWLAVGIGLAILIMILSGVFVGLCRGYFGKDDDREEEDNAER